MVGYHRRAALEGLEATQHHVAELPAPEGSSVLDDEVVVIIHLRYRLRVDAYCGTPALYELPGAKLLLTPDDGGPAHRLTMADLPSSSEMASIRANRSP